MYFFFIRNDKQLFPQGKKQNRRRTINKEIAINGGGTRRASEIAEKHQVIAAVIISDAGGEK